MSKWSFAVGLPLLLVALIVMGAAAGAEETSTAAPIVENTVSKGEPVSFQAEVSKMLDILINSLYTNRDVFLRELISNGSDALDKIRLLYLTAPKEPVNRDGKEASLDIRLHVDQNLKTLTLQDGGIGMTRQELEDHLGSLGTSGTKRFMEKMKETKDASLIGQFGVGFYSAFLVADRVRVASKSDDSDTQWVWESSGDGKYYIYEDERGNTLGRGTEITLELKPDAVEYLQVDNVKRIVHQYSEFVHFPIMIQQDEKWEVLNENKPIWTRKPSEVKEEEYFKFYKALTHDYRNPMHYSHFFVEGDAEFSSVLFVPEEASSDMFINTENTRDNIKLYVRRIFITDEFRELLPRYLNFIKGVVDSDDLPLNVSREVLQESRILRVIKKKLVRKALAMISEIVARDARIKEESSGDSDEKKTTELLYPKFWAQFGKHMRLGILEDVANRARLAKLLRFTSSKSDGALTSLQEYTSRMKPGQKNIYFLTGDTTEAIKESPHVEEALMRDIEVLYMTDAIDEYVFSQLQDFESIRFVNLAKEGVQFDEQTDRDRAIAKKRNAKFQPLFKRLTELFKGNNLRKVILTKRQSSEAFILSSLESDPSPHMVNVMKQQAITSSNTMGYSRVLEINHRHPLVQDLLKRFTEDADDSVAIDVSWVLFATASLQADFPVPEPSKYAKRVSRLLRGRMNLAVDDNMLPPDDDEYDISEEDHDNTATTDGVLLPLDDSEDSLSESAEVSAGNEETTEKEEKVGTTDAGDL